MPFVGDAEVRWDAEDDLGNLVQEKMPVYGRGCLGSRSVLRAFGAPDDGRCGSFAISGPTGSAVCWHYARGSCKNFDAGNIIKSKLVCNMATRRIAPRR